MEGDPEPSASCYRLPGHPGSLRLAGEDNMLILALVVIVAALLVFSPKMPEGQALHKAGTGKEERTL